DHGSEGAAVAPVTPALHGRDLYPLAGSLLDTPLADQIVLLTRLDTIARAHDPAITNVFAGLGLEHRLALVAGPDGLLVAHVRPLVRVGIMGSAERGGRRPEGRAGGGGR